MKGMNREERRRLRKTQRVEREILRSLTPAEREELKHLRARCSGCEERELSPCGEADYFMVALLKYGTNMLLDPAGGADATRLFRIWIFQYPYVEDGMTHVVCRIHRKKCVNCKASLKADGIDLEKAIVDLEWPDTEEFECLRGHWQQEYVFQTYGFEPRLCPDCLTVPQFEHDPNFDREQHRMRAGLRAWKAETGYRETETGE